MKNSMFFMTLMSLSIALLSVVLWAEPDDEMDDSVLINLFREKFTKVAPQVEDLTFEVTEKTNVIIEGKNNQTPNSESWMVIDKASPAFIWSPDSLAFAILAFGDPPDMVFVSSLADSVNYYPYTYLTHTILLDAFWIDVHQFVMLYIYRLFNDRPPALHASLFNLEKRQKTIWTVSYSGTLPEGYVIRDTVMKYEYPRMKK
jgi:hypothetical protein